MGQRIEGLAQFATTAEGDSADAWLTQFETDNAARIEARGTMGGHERRDLDPPHLEPGDEVACPVEIQYGYFLVGDDADVLPLCDAINCNVMGWGGCPEGTTAPVSATCGSGSGLAPEPD
jgi:hypothetical protein